MKVSLTLISGCWCEHQRLPSCHHHSWHQGAGWSVRDISHKDLAQSEASHAQPHHTFRLHDGAWDCLLSEAVLRSKCSLRCPTNRFCSIIHVLLWSRCVLQALQSVCLTEYFVILGASPLQWVFVGELLPPEYKVLAGVATGLMVMSGEY